MTTQEKNEVIARWMGLKPYEDNRYGTMWPDPTKNDSVGFGLKYDKSWEWLMPVVEKIESLGTRIVIYDNKAHIESHDLANDEQFYGSKGTKIGATYDCVFKFIEWYNANFS